MKATKSSVVITPAVAEVRETTITLEMNEKEAHKLLCLLAHQACDSRKDEYVPGWDELRELLFPEGGFEISDKLLYQTGTISHGDWRSTLNWCLRKRAAR